MTAGTGDGLGGVRTDASQAGPRRRPGFGPPLPLPDLVALCDRDGRILSLDADVAKAWGMSGTDSPVGRSFIGLGFPENLAQAFHRRFGAALRTGRPSSEELRLEPAGAAEPGNHGRVIECWLAPVTGAGVAAAILTARDVTAARRAERAVRDSERAYRLLAENSTDMISRHDPDGVYLYVSPACRAILGLEPEQLVGRSAYEIILADDHEEVHRIHAKVLEGDDAYTLTFRALHVSGRVVWAETIARVVRDVQTGAVREIHASTRDVTSRMEAEKKLRESRELLQAVLDNSPAVVYIKDTQGHYVLVNHRFEELFKVTREEMLGRTDRELFSDVIAAAFQANDRKVIEARKPIEFEEIAPHEDGPHTYLSVKFPLFGQDGEPNALCGISTDITFRERAEVALKEQSELLQSILDTMSDAVVVADASERFLVFNPAAERMFGMGATETASPEWSERYGLFLPDRVTRFPTEDLPLVRALREEEAEDVEIFVRHEGNPEGSWVVVNARPVHDALGQPRAGLAVCRDVTERKRAEAQLRAQNDRLKEAIESERNAHETLKHAEVSLVQAEKLAALGQLVAGVAHEINNPLAFVLNNLSVLERDAASMRKVLSMYHQDADPILEIHNPDAIAQIREVSEAVDLNYTLDNLERLTSRSREGLKRIQQIVKDLREFARLDDTDLQTADLNSGIVSTVTIIMGRAHNRGVKLETQLSPIPAITCYPAKINQVFMNLIANAIDACGPEGHVVVTTEPAPAPDGVGDAGVLTKVSDNGHGIPPEIRPKIFDPFFTTKPIGKGTGLGLSISYGIVKAHGGKITVESEIGQGTTFSVWLPVVPRVAAAAKP